MSRQTNQLDKLAWLDDKKNASMIPQIFGLELCFGSQIFKLTIKF
jgi:hypothetical protein